MERYVDKKLEKAEQALKKGENRTRRWYEKFCGSGESKGLCARETPLFLISFAAGVAIGIASAD